MLYPGAVQNDFIPRFAYAGTRISNEQRVGTNNAPFYNYNTTIEWIDNLTKVWNQHVLKASLYIQRSRMDQTSFANSSGDINFGDSSSNPFDTGFGFANMALGVYTSYTHNFNISLQKEFAYTERVRLQLRADAFNHTQFSGINSTLNISALTNGTFTNLYLNPNGTINNKNGFGTVSGARDPRIMQLVLRIQF